MAELTAKCPMCASVLKSKSEAELVRMLREHARREHGTDLPADKARQMIEEERVGKE
ncbi:MAG: DUF1059 domain-containing protein [Chloroflexi bacterium]|nr:DUF1059 domain-containing protein [Chloroflexota bacterium]